MKKYFSIVLAISLVIGIMPTLHIEATAETQSGEVATASEAIEEVSATPSEATASDANIDFVYEEPTQEDIPYWYSRMSTERPVFMFVTRNGDFLYRTYGLWDADAQTYEWYASDYDGNVARGEVAVELLMEEQTLAPYIFRNGVVTDDVLAELGYGDEYEYIVDDYMGINLDGTYFSIYQFSRDLSDYGELVHYWFYGYCENDDGHSNTAWYECDESGNVIYSNTLAPLGAPPHVMPRDILTPDVTYSVSGDSVTFHFTGNFFDNVSPRVDPKPDVMLNFNGSSVAIAEPNGRWGKAFDSDHYFSRQSSSGQHLYSRTTYDGLDITSTGTLTNPVYSTLDLTALQASYPSARWGLEYSYQDEGAGDTYNGFNAAAFAMSELRPAADSIIISNNSTVTGTYEDGRTMYLDYTVTLVNPSADISGVSIVWQGYYLDGSHRFYEGIGSFGTTESEVTTGVAYTEGYFVQYRLQHGTGDDTEAGPIEPGVTYTTNAAPTLTGYVFDGFNTAADGSGTTYAASTSYIDMASKGDTIILYAQWTPITYRVAIRAGAGTIQGFNTYFSPYLTYTENFTFPAASMVIRRGYRATGYTGVNVADRTFGDTAMSLVTVNNGLAIYEVEYLPYTYTLVYDGNGNTGGSTSNTTVTYDLAYTYSDCGYTRLGYTFDGWNTEPDGSGESITPGDTDTNFSELALLTAVDTPATYTIYAQWRPVTYDINYDGNGSTGGNTRFTRATYGNSYTYCENGFTKTGYSFTGWNTQRDGSGATVAAGSTDTDMSRMNIGTFDPSATYTLYAQWSPISYTLRYDGNGGTIDVAYPVFNAIYDQILTLELNRYTNEHFSFQGWTLAPNTGTAYSQGQTVSNLSAVNGTEVVLFASWLRESYTVIFRDMHGNNIDSQVVSVGGSATAPAAPSETGYNFSGWNGTFDNVQSDMVLTAQYTRVESGGSSSGGSSSGSGTVSGSTGSSGNGSSTSTPQTQTTAAEETTLESTEEETSSSVPVIDLINIGNSGSSSGTTGRSRYVTETVPESTEGETIEETTENPETLPQTTVSVNNEEETTIVIEDETIPQDSGETITSLGTLIEWVKKNPVKAVVSFGSVLIILFMVWFFFLIGRRKKDEKED